jgi:hypothetical protein
LPSHVVEQELLRDMDKIKMPQKFLWTWKGVILSKNETAEL